MSSYSIPPGKFYAGTSFFPPYGPASTSPPPPPAPVVTAPYAQIERIANALERIADALQTNPDDNV